MRQLAGGARRIRWFDMGESTEGRPFFYLCISSPKNLERLEELREIQSRLADPRGLSSDEGDRLVGLGKTVVLISCSIHATEVGAAQMSMELAYELETLDDPKILEILDNVILILIPSLNPDGLDMVVDWYKKYLGTEWEGVSPPFLYQKYAGHDNNRDWFMLNLVENRLTVEKVHHVWHPHIVFDLHQMGDLGFRLFVPPYLDPYDPNVDYILRQEIADLGSHIVSEVISTGKTGVSCYNGYDAFAPSRAYQHYHGGVRILIEAASAKLATPVTRRQDELRPTRDGADPRVATWNHPIPWPGGEWRLRDIVEYEKVASLGCLSHAAKFRELWVSNFLKLSRRACERKEPYAFILPRDQRDPVSLYELLKVLHMGQVEIHQASEDFEVDGVTHKSGSYVIRLAQPYGAYAKTLLEVQEYPDLRQYPGGPPKLPYDVTGHTLPLLMGVKAYLAKSPFVCKMSAVQEPSLPEGSVMAEDEFQNASNTGTSCRAPVPHEPTDPGLPTHTETWLAIEPSVNAAAKVVNRLLSDSCEVYRTTVSYKDGDRIVEAGTFLVPVTHRHALDAACREYGVCARGISWSSPVKSPRLLLRMPRTAVYKSYRPNADEGWLRYVLEEYGFPYESVENGRLRKGGLNGEFDTIVFPSQAEGFLRDGNRPGTCPPEYTGGLGPEGKDAIVSFVEMGGTCVFLDASCGWAVSEFGLPCTNVVRDKKPQDFFAPGSVLKVVVDTGHPLGFGLPRETAVMFNRSPAWDVYGGTVVARYPTVNPLLSGWLLGGQYLINRAALVEFLVGFGRVVLVGFHPHFRAQSRGTYKVVFNSLYLGSSVPQ
ncbi:MAG: M14 family zinc carboxypeptidase [Bacillota bacterium]